MPEPKSTSKTEDMKTTEAAAAAPAPEFKTTEGTKTARAEDDFIFTGRLGFYQILGIGFGGSGTVTIGGADAPVTAWGAERIEGRMPADGAKIGDEIVVHLGHRTQRATYAG